MTVANNAQQANNKNAPSVLNRWRFAGLSAAELLPHLQRHLTAQNPNANWQLVWLNNNEYPVIGLLPKTSWSVYFNANQNTCTPLQISKSQIASYKIIKTWRDNATCRDNVNNKTTISQSISYNDWQNELIDYSQNYTNTTNPAISQSEQKPMYEHGLIGFIGYDIAAWQLSPTVSIQQAAQPCAVLGHYDIYLTPSALSDNVCDSEWQLNVQKTLVNSDRENKEKNKILSALITYLDDLDKELSDKSSTNKTESIIAPLLLSAQWHKSTYQQAFALTQRYLVEGDCYQVNLTQAWLGQMSDNQLIDYLPTLHRNTSAPFAGYLNVTDLETSDPKNNGFELLSCSPELFFTFTTDSTNHTRHIITKPIKGTTPRGMDIEQDLALKEQLVASEKDRSENVMIVDLLRNDLGKYAKVGSVKVPQLFAIESFSNVHHMVSTITAELKADCHPLKVLFGSLPAGSITGAPKKRAVEIISELEAQPRGAYCGTMGYMNFDGSGQWNVLIRTLQASTDADNNKKVSLWAGGGITIASDCNAEYQECLDKVGNLLTVLAQKKDVIK